MQLYPFINKYNWYGINFASEKDDLAKFEKLNSTIALNGYIKKKRKYLQLIFKNIIQPVKNKSSF